MFGLSFVAPELITITITDKWTESAKILQLLCISGAFIPVINLCSNLLISKGKSNIYMWNTISLVIFQLFVMLLCHPYGIHTMIIIYVAINISWLLIWHHFVQKEISYSLNSLIKDITPFLLITTGAIAISYFCMANCDNIYLKFAGEIGIVAILYLSTMWATGSQTFKESLYYLLKRKKV
jgi:O-antigen/teichoic acid export membrane protein